MSVWLYEYLAEDEQIEDFMTQYLNIRAPSENSQRCHLYISSLNVREYLGQHSLVSLLVSNLL